MRGTVAENAFFLAGKVEEVGLCCLEAEASAHASEAEIPVGLAELPLRWHVHLPLDLPWESGGGGEAGRKALAVWKRVEFLQPWLAVLHLPPASAGGAWLRDFLRVWRTGGPSSRCLALENVRQASPVRHLREIEDLDLSLCLDMAHLMAYGQEEILRHPALMARVRLVHWSAPGPAEKDGTPRDRHRALDEWTPAQRRTAEEGMEKLSADVTHLVEVFHWEGILRSWPVLRDLRGRFG